MGKYLNPGYDGFEEIRRDIYVDKSGLITYMNSLIGKPKPLVCFSRPRRFGKTFAADMLCAYYDKSCDSRFLFGDLEVAESDSFMTHLNQYNVLSFDVTGFITKSGECGTNILMKMQKALLEDLRQAFPDCQPSEEDSLADALYKIVTKGNAKFVFVIDEWDALFREFKDDTDLQRDYILLLRSLFKNKDVTTKVVAAAYMTGILPVKKYGTESAVSDFKEFTMENPAKLAEYVGFTEAEVRKLCGEYHMDFAGMRTWYDGYSFSKIKHVYSPNSVMSAIQNEEFRNYWTKTESFESLKKYISMNQDGLRDAVILMLGGQRVAVDTGTFQNDVTSFSSKDDVLTLLIHLGYLAYNQAEGEVYIPNREVAEIFRSSVKGGKWAPVERAISQAERLLDVTIRGDSEKIAESLELVHEECSSALTYNDENSLACAIYIAYYTARNYYMIIRELPAGKGFADYAFIPRPDSDKPAMVIELKYDKDADTAIRQIHDNRYAGALKDYSGSLLLVGINYDKDAKGKKRKKHSCVVERM
ncbi:MAG: ATP-binding protein [Lachnospiraceae bacterium]|nr:ATP-binding protein [Lachnospiraceae bacterium]